MERTISLSKLKARLDAVLERRKPPHQPNDSHPVGDLRCEVLEKLEYGAHEKLWNGHYDSQTQAAAHKRLKDLARSEASRDVSHETLTWLVERIYQYEERNDAASLSKPRQHWDEIVYYEEIIAAGPAESEEAAQEYADPEIMIVRNGPRGRDLFAGTPVARWVTGRIDPISVLRFDETTGTNQIIGGDYVVLDVPSRPRYGAVGLLIDPKNGPLGSPGVALIAQFRYGPQRFLLEAPRGFSDPYDPDELPFHTLLREAGEETGVDVRPEEVYLLRDMYTDSGKLADRPSFFLVFVDRNRPSDALREEPVAAPLWYRLEDFYRAVLSLEPLTVTGYDPFDDPWLREHRPHLLKDTFRNKYRNVLEVADCFTISTAFLSLPYLLRRFPEINWTDILRSS
jgi:8-oxo-dGTP pyrophosphatase MutT (NUDIX family)